jgi:signal peptidase
METLIILGLLGAIYLAINIGLPRLPVDTRLSTYLFQPLLWCGLVLAVRGLQPQRALGKLSQRGKLMGLAAIIAFSQVLIYAICGLFSSFGSNPSSLSLSGIVTNIFFVGAMLIGLEFSRAWLIGRYAKRHRVLALVLISLVYTFIAIPLSQLTGFRPQIESANIIISSWLPLLAENLFASVLALHGGWRPALLYRAMLAAFWWFCPILPDLPWSFQGLIGTVAPGLGMVAVNQFFARDLNHGRARPHREGSTAGAGWVVTAIACMLLIWFAVGIFPLKPSVILSGSMNPYMKVGDVAIVGKASAKSIKVGDVIEFRQSDRTRVLHRVIAISEVGGMQAFETKGDVNNAPDTNLVAPENVVGRVVGVVPGIGWVSITIKSLFTG